MRARVMNVAAANLNSLTTEPGLSVLSDSGLGVVTDERMETTVQHSSDHTYIIHPQPFQFHTKPTESIGQTENLDRY
jgi:hypothetical protein